MGSMDAIYNEVKPPEDLPVPVITDDAAKKQAELVLEYRRSLKMIEDQRQEIRRHLDTLHGFEETLHNAEHSDIRNMVVTVAQGQAEQMQRVAGALENLDATLREKIPSNKAPMIMLDKEVWHIKLGFTYPNPDGETSTSYGPGDPIPDHMTQGDLERLYEEGHIYRFEKNPVTGTGVYTPHPKLVQLNRAQMMQLLGQPVPFVCHFLVNNHIRLDTLLRLKVAVAEFEKETRTLDPRIHEALDRKIKQMEER